jgi:hypothetical protein
MAVVWALRRPCRPWPPTASLALLRTASAARVPKAGEGPVKHATARLFHKRRTSTVVMAMRANAGDASSPQSGRTNACIPGNVADPLPRPAPVRRHQVRTRRRQESGDPLPDRENNPRLRKELAIPIVPALDDVLKLASAARRHTSKPSMASRLRRPALAIGFATCAMGPFKDCRPWPPQGPPGHRLRERSNRPRIDGDRRARVGERDVALHRETRSRQACAERHEEARRGTSPERKFRT